VSVPAPLCIGLFGGIGAGKSAIANLLAEHGAGVIDADRVAHDCLREPAVRDALVAHFGPSILAAAGSVDRAALARVAFADPGSVAALNAIVHPAVGRRMEAQLAQFAAEGVRVAVLDGAVLTEAGWADRCEWRLYVDAPEAVREARVQSRGWPPGERARREARQVSVEAKRQAADAVIANDGSLERTRDAVARFWRERVAPRLARDSAKA
jgi:dephospho-CoA kinase